ncbi:AhpD family alkylhydroperoxidase [Sphingobacterium allocomposti]|uniref:AhpD family alkylhydroperoxidase n=1 Tax=Sphingobacterium allocomposti TaxID=415956 RepID=A0A5S5DQK3_9SPHI|nr:carboxymuconolactone decarboxylase family protein [Sphingobacterium composti Yoo et al. 2007 non Ten et al. 2007]TYP96949.1 AhpD family alkylhydroperoxidase [Sphingobacterium composti Yoo et al. 2007 non Ten et al. 2007]
MTTRININAVEPAAYKAMYALEVYLQGSKLTTIQKELIKIRASQLNGCAFCINMHTSDALAAGETSQRIFLLNAWKETNLFTEEEKVMLAMTEEITLLPKAGLSEETYRRAARLFDEQTIAQIIIAIVTINGWNRIAVSTNLPVAG